MSCLWALDGDVLSRAVWTSHKQAAPFFLSLPLGPHSVFATSPGVSFSQGDCSKSERSAGCSETSMIGPGEVDTFRYLVP